MNNKQTVFIVNDSGHDYSAAREFGRLEFLSTGALNKFAVNHMFRLFSKRLAKSDPDDWLLNSGLPQMQQVAASIFVQIHGRLNLLLFKAEGGDIKYVPRTIVLDNISNLYPEIKVG